MKIFSLQGIIIFFVYLVVVDRVATMIPAIPYKSIVSSQGLDDTGGFSVFVPIVAVSAVAIVLVMATPRIF